jgi:hypothetical protein
MVVCVLFHNGNYIGCYDSLETAERALSRPDSRISRDAYYLNIDDKTYEVLVDTMITEGRLIRSGK